MKQVAALLVLIGLFLAWGEVGPGTAQAPKPEACS